MRPNDVAPGAHRLGFHEVPLRRGLASAPGELPIWGTLLVVTTVIALVLLASIQRERVASP
jgi:hypothetical protein